MEKLCQKGLSGSVNTRCIVLGADTAYPKFAAGVDEAPLSLLVARLIFQDTREVRRRKRQLINF